MSFPDGGAERTHQTADYTQRFVDVLYPNCEVRPHFTDLKMVGSTEG